MLEFDDIQYILLTRAPAITGRYEFLSFRNAAAGRAWLAAILETVHSVQQARASIEKDNRWVSVAFTWNGLRALGADEGSLASFPEEFKQGMVARAEVLGDTGANHPDNWLGVSPVRTSTPSSFSLPATKRSACGARRSTINSSRSATVWKCSRHLIWRQRRHSIMRMTTSVTAIGCLSRSSRDRGRSRRQAPARR